MLPEEKRGKRTLETLAGCIVCRNSAIALTHARGRTLWTENKTAVELDGKENKDEIKEKKGMRGQEVTSQPGWYVQPVPGLRACDHFQPGDHVGGKEGQRWGATSTSTHTRPDCLRRTCTAGSSLRGWPQSRSLRRSPRATSCRTSYPSTPWSSSLHSGRQEKTAPSLTDNIRIAQSISPDLG